MNKLVCTLSCHQYYQQKFVIQHTLHQLTKPQPGLSSPLFNSQFMHLVELICKKPGIVQVLRSNTKESGQFPNQEFALQGPNLLRSFLTCGGFLESTGGVQQPALPKAALQETKIYPNHTKYISDSTTAPGLQKFSR